MGVIKWTVLQTVLFLDRAHNCLKGSEELFENPAVLNIFDSFRSVLVLLGPFLHALVTSNINYYTLHSEGYLTAKLRRPVPLRPLLCDHHSKF